MGGAFGVFAAEQRPKFQAQCAGRPASEAGAWSWPERATDSMASTAAIAAIATELQSCRFRELTGLQRLVLEAGDATARFFWSPRRCRSWQGRLGRSSGRTRGPSTRQDSSWSCAVQQLRVCFNCDGTKLANMRLSCAMPENSLETIVCHPSCTSRLCRGMCLCSLGLPFSIIFDREDLLCVTSLSPCACCAAHITGSC